MSTIPQVFFDRYYMWEEVVGYLEEVARWRPGMVRVVEIGRTPEGRALLCAQVSGPEGDAERKPAYLVQANVHGLEVAGTTAALYLIRYLLEGYERDAELRQLLNRVCFHVVPRMNPDGAEFALRTGGAVRSRTRPRYRPNGVYQADVNGDGLILTMRRLDPCGNMKPHPQDGRLLVPRRAEDRSGPFYTVQVEGLVYDWDGGPLVEAERSLDFNRNWAAQWQPEYEQPGAGDYPFSEPEMRALAEYVYARPNIYGMLGFHCGCNAVLRPPSTGSDDDLPRADLEKMKEIGAQGEALTGFKLRAVVEYKPDKDKPIALRGHFHDWGYRHLGLHVFEIELGNLYNSCGITTERYFAVSEEERRDFDLVALRWHDEHRDKGAFVDWQPFMHPQLGEVEIGGWRRCFLANPASEEMAEIAPRCARFVVEHARRGPVLAVGAVEARHVEGRVYRVLATVLNVGDLPTQISEMGHRVTQNEPVRVRLEGVEVISRGAVREVGHLAEAGGRSEQEWFVRAEPGAEGRIVAESQKAGRAEAVIRFD